MSLAQKEVGTSDAQASTCFIFALVGCTLLAIDDDRWHLIGSSRNPTRSPCSLHRLCQHTHSEHAGVLNEVK